MNAAGEDFQFNHEQRLLIVDALRAGPSEAVNTDECIESIQTQNRVYLTWRAAAKALPSADRIEQRRIEDERARARVIEGIRRARGVNCGLVDQACADPESLTVKVLMDKVAAGEVSIREFEAAVAARFIVAGKLRMEPFPTWLFDDNQRHRRSLFESVTRVWLRCHHLDLNQLRISEGSKGVGGAFLRFVQASTLPALSLTGEAVGDRQVCNIIRDIKASPSKSLQLDLGMIGSYA